MPGCWPGCSASRQRALSAALSPPAEQSQGLLVDGSARADRDQPDHAARGDPVDDSEPAHSQTPEARELITQRLARRGVRADQVEGRTNLALQAGMEAPNKLLEPPRDPETVGLHVGGSPRSVRGQQLLQCVDPPASL